MKCKKCGAEIVPGKSSCPSCNTPYTIDDNLAIPDISTDDLEIPILPEDIGNPIIEENEENKTSQDDIEELNIVPIDVPKVNKGYQDPLLSLDKESIANPSKSDNVEPVKKEIGNDKPFIYLGAFVLVVGISFFIYITFINKNFIDNLIKKPDEQLTVPTNEPDNVKKESISLKELDKYIKNDASKQEVIELFNYKKILTKSMLHYIEEDKFELILYKKENNDNVLLKDYKNVIKQMENELDENSTYTININENKNDIVIVVINNKKEDIINNPESNEQNITDSTTNDSKTDTQNNG